MSDKFKSEYFQDADALVQGKNAAWEGVRSRRERLRIVRNFSNMLPTLSEEEADKLGRQEITCYGLAHMSLVQLETQLAAMITQTNGLLDVVVDTDDPENDLDWGLRISQAINRGAIHFKGRFANFWRKVSGEITIAGGCPAILNERYGWLPELRPDMFFPKGTSLDTEEVTYAFDPCELTRDDLEKMLKSVVGEEGKYVQVANLKKLLNLLNKQIADNTKSSSDFSKNEISTNSRDSGGSKSATVSAWRYYEMKYKDNGDQYVSCSLFTDGGLSSGGYLEELKSDEKGRDSRKSVSLILTYDEFAYKDAGDWLHMVFIDSEIGGTKNVESSRGVAEMIYPSSVEMEELVNLMMEGDKFRAKPRFSASDEASIDDLQRWDSWQDSFVPKGVEVFEMGNSSASLQVPFALLRNNAASMAQASVSNSDRGQELRQQALERQQNSAQLTGNRLSEAYNHLESLLSMMVWRILAGPIKPGTEGYREIKFIRAELERYGIPYKELAKRKFGRFLYLQIRCKRTIANGDRKQQIDTADWLMTNIMSVAPAARPLLIKQAIALHTQDPDLASAVVQVPQAIINSQKVTAENECDTIRRRSVLGQELPVNPEDIHQDHIPVHLLDLQALLARDQYEPWKKLDLLQFTGLARHTAEHIRILLENPATNAEAKGFIMDWENIIQASSAIAQRIQEEEAEAEGMGQLTAKERADLELKWAAEHRKSFEVGMKLENNQRLWQQQQSRANISKRSQYANEVFAGQRLNLDRQRLENEGQSQD